jgi:hypothetical protein
MARKRLDTLKGVAAELARIYGDIDAAVDPADNSEVRLRTHVLSALKDTLQQTALEMKLDELERVVRARFELKRVM